MTAATVFLTAIGDRYVNFQDELEPLTRGETVTVAIPPELKELADLECLIEDIKEAAMCLLPTHNIRIGIGNGKISISTRKYGSNGWEEAYRRQSQTS